MGWKLISLLIMTLLGQFSIFSQASVGIDGRGFVYFTEDKSITTEKYGQPSKKIVLAEKKGEKDHPKGDQKGKQPVNLRGIEPDVADSFKNILSLWKDRKYDALYDCGDRKSRTSVTKEDFGKRMTRKAWELATSWETVRDIEVDVKHSTLAYATAKIGYKPKNGGETRVQTKTYEMRLENGAWRVNLTKLLSFPK